MRETTRKKVKEFEIANDARVDVDESAPCRTVTIWLKEKGENTPRFAVQAFEICKHTKYISTLDAGGGIIAFPHPVSGDIYQAETWEGEDSCDTFVERALHRVPESRQYDRDSCGECCA